MSAQHHVLAWYAGYCASCQCDQPLVLTETGPWGLRAWLSGAGAEDRELSYTCRVCGRLEPVPATEQEDEAYDATLLRWPDLVVPTAASAAAPVAQPVAEAAPVTAPVVPSAHDVWSSAITRIVTAPEAVAAPRAVVRTVVLPAQRVSVADLRVVAA